MGRHKWEMNNIYEHTTLAHNSRNGWERNTTLGTWTLNFMNISEDMNPYIVSILGIWQGTSWSFHLGNLIWQLRCSAKNRMNAMSSSHILYRLFLLVLDFFVWTFVICLSTRRLFYLVMYTTASCLFPAVFASCFSRRNANVS
jgi:hypothetical protein